MSQVEQAAAFRDDHDIPFMLPADKLITLYLPPPVSVNKARRVDWNGARAVRKWVTQADMKIMANGGVRRLGKITGQFEVKIVIDENLSNCDADNTAKILIDYCRRLELIVDDSKKYMRRVIIEWGHAPTGCRVILREMGA